MARLSKDAVQAREAFLFKLFSEKPKLTIPSANEALKAKFGSNMRPQRVSEIRAQAAAKAGENAPEKPEVTVAGRMAIPKVKKAAKRGVVAPGYGSEAEALQAALAALQAAGATNIEIYYTPPARRVTA